MDARKRKREENQEGEPHDEEHSKINGGENGRKGQGNHHFHS